MFTNIDRVQLASGMVVVAPWNIDYGQGAVRTNSILVGVAVMLFAAWSAMAQPAPLRN